MGGGAARRTPDELGTDAKAGRPRTERTTQVGRVFVLVGPDRRSGHRSTPTERCCHTVRVGRLLTIGYGDNSEYSDSRRGESEFDSWLELDSFQGEVSHRFQEVDGQVFHDDHEAE